MHRELVNRFDRARRFLSSNEGTLQRRALRSGAWVGMASVATTALTFIRGVVLARLLAPEIFGLMAAALMATRLIEILTETGFGAALVHRQKRFDEACDTAFTLMVVRGFVLCLLSVLIAPFVASFYGEPGLKGVVALGGISLLVMGFQNINIVALQKELDFRRISLMEMTGTVLSSIAMIGFALWRRDVWALVYGQIVSAAIASALSFLMVPGRLRFRFDYEVAKELYQYGRFITGLAIVVFLTRELDSALIGRLLGMEMLGFYVTAYSLANIPSTYLSKVISRVFFPLFSKLQSDAHALAVEYLRGVTLITISVIPLSLLIATLAPEIISVLYGRQWEPAIVPLQVLTIFGCCRALWMINGYLYNAIGRPNVDFYLSLCRLLCMGALLYPLTLNFGVIGAAVAVTIPMALQFVVGIYLSFKFIGISPSRVLQPLLSAALQGSIVIAVLFMLRGVLGADPLLRLTLLLGVGASGFVLLNIRRIRGVAGG